MEFKRLTKRNAATYFGKPIVFQLSGKPRLAQFKRVQDKYLVLSSFGQDFLLSVTHPVVVILDKYKSHRATYPYAKTFSTRHLAWKDDHQSEPFHYPMNFLLASNTTYLLQYVGHYVIVRSDRGKTLSLFQIKSISRSLQYLDLENVSSRQIVDIRHTPCYIIV
jgi:hypothetical protein